MERMKKKCGGGKRKLHVLFGLTFLLAVAVLGCATTAKDGTTITAYDQFKSGVATEKGIAEAILFNARVLYNQKVITADQYGQVRLAYEKLRVTQNSLLDSYAAMIQKPNSPASGKFQLDSVQLIKDIQTLMSLGTTFGVIKAEGVK